MYAKTACLNTSDMSAVLHIRCYFYLYIHHINIFVMLIFDCLIITLVSNDAFYTTWSIYIYIHMSFIYLHHKIFAARFLRVTWLHQISQLFIWQRCQEFCSGDQHGFATRCCRFPTLQGAKPESMTKRQFFGGWKCKEWNLEVETWDWYLIIHDYTTNYILYPFISFYNRFYPFITVYDHSNRVEIFFGFFFPFCFGIFPVF